jgi:hypothetical protein
MAAPFLAGFASSTDSPARLFPPRRLLFRRAGSLLRGLDRSVFRFGRHIEEERLKKRGEQVMFSGWRSMALILYSLTNVQAQRPKVDKVKSMRNYVQIPRSVERVNN